MIHLRSGSIRADELQDYLSGSLTGLARERVAIAIQNDAEIAHAFRLIRSGAKRLRSRRELQTEIPADWLAIISRWPP